MTSARSKTVTHTTAADTTQAVDAFMQGLDHPFKNEIETIRRTILAADPAIAEGIKWHVPSFRTTEYFATLNLRAKAGIGVILHLGAKVRDTATTGLPIHDPEQLLTWLAKDRASVTFAGAADIDAKQPAFTALLQQWISHV
jgi:hypothetical protein